MVKSSTSDANKVGAAMPGRVSPSTFMRKLRPEYYSDTEDRVSYVLDAPTLDHHLNTITSRNETHEFELFVRKLCERAICPNLRPQTGPEGGGDSKADTETYPVADEISRVYIGEPNGGRERWAFAFSANKKWSEKVRSDVKGIVDTRRSYDQVICVTSRFARAKDRARLEDELSKKYGLPVTIHDRSWIMKEVIENDRKDIAFNYLGIGEAKSDPFRLGPTDYSRAQQLAVIEKSLADPEAFRGMEGQRVTEALVAAKLSRNLEHPRTETDGRFLRAIRLANADGSYRQKLEVQYEHIWSGFWWFDDVQLVNDSYSAFEAMTLNTDHASNLEFLCNLHQLLVNTVIYGHLSREACKLDERTAALRQALEVIAANQGRPNNSLEAQTSLLILRQSCAMVDKKPEDLSGIWRDYIGILERAAGLGEFKAKQLISMIEVVGKIAGNDAAYNELIEKLADFVAKRTSEAEGALILLKRAQQLDFSDRIDMIRLLGKAAIGLSKKEYTERLIEALHLLMIAYRGAGLLWAARATCIMAAASIVIEGEEDSAIPVSFVPTIKVWAWIALGLRHIPDLLYAIQLLNGAHATLPLTDDSKERVSEDIRELEYALASIFLNLSDAEVRQLEGLPDILEGLGLFMARAALLYTLGYAAFLREDDSVPKEETDESVERMFSILASQPVARQTRGPLILNGAGRQSLSATILGMTVEITFEGSLQLTLVAEAVLGALEAFFATVIDQRVFPHTEKFQIKLIESAAAPKPAIETSALDMSATVTWPAALSLTNILQQQEIRKFLAEISGHVLATTCMIDDVAALLDKLYRDEAVDARMAMISAAATSHHRVASRNVSRLSDWKKVVKREYPLQLPRPQLKILDLKVPGADADEDGGAASGDVPALTSHRAVRVRSVIDVHAWDQARWRGTLYLQFGPGKPPGLAFMFEEKAAAMKIFERWRERFGASDANEEIYLAIIRHRPNQNPHHYILMVTSRLPNAEERDPKQAILTASRSMTMTPDSATNLQGFLDAYQQTGAFYLMPAVITNGAPELMRELALVKRHISVKDAASVGGDDIEGMALRMRA
jgi:hypothetical protein